MDSDPNSDDLFGVFDDDSDASSLKSGDAGEDAPLDQLRDPECGVLSHHPGIEQALLHYVENALRNNRINGVERREKILKLVDQFCFTRHWMMHVGPEKGATLESFLEESLKLYVAKGKRDKPFVVVELGTYCGYSAIRMAHKILQCLNREDDGKGCRFQIVTVDVNPQTVEVARQLVSLAGFEKYVTFLLIDSSQKDAGTLSISLIRCLKRCFGSESPPGIDFLFVDHDKDAYLPDVLELEEAGLIRAGSHVAADNVIFFHLSSYRQRVQEVAAQGIVKSRLELGVLEYVDDRTKESDTSQYDFQDGIGK